MQCKTKCRLWAKSGLTWLLAADESDLRFYFILIPSRALSSLNTIAIASMIRMPGFALQ